MSGRGERAPRGAKRAFPFPSDEEESARWQREERALDRYLDGLAPRAELDPERFRHFDPAGTAFYDDYAAAPDGEEVRARPQTAAAVAAHGREMRARVRGKRALYAERFGCRADGTLLPAPGGAGPAAAAPAAAATCTFDARTCEDAHGGADPDAAERIANSIVFAQCELFLPCFDDATPPGALAALGPRTPLYAVAAEVAAAVQGGGGAALQLLAERAPAGARRLDERVLVFAAAQAAPPFHLVLWLRQAALTPAQRVERAAAAQDDAAAQGADALAGLGWYVARRFYVPPACAPA